MNTLRIRPGGIAVGPNRLAAEDCKNVLFSNISVKSRKLIRILLLFIHVSLLYIYVQFLKLLKTRIEDKNREKVSTFAA